MTLRAAGGMMAAFVACLLLSTGCGDRTLPEAPETKVGAAEPGELPHGVVPAGYHGRVRGTVTVLESPDHGPQLCANVAESYPPQCGGPDIEGWRWDDLRSESANGTTWGRYTVTGHLADDVFTLTEPAQPPQDDPPAAGDPASPCPEPAGGWVPPDPATATPEARDEAIKTARSAGGHGGVWIRWLIPRHEITEFNSVDPALYVLNVSTTGDVGELERELRAVWGGNLCVVATARTEAELNRIANQLMSLPGATSASADIVKGTASVTVWVATEELWRQAARDFGEDAVELDGILEPLD